MTVDPYAVKQIVTAVIEVLVSIYLAGKRKKK